jgi:hypothetical protein
MYDDNKTGEEALCVHECVNRRRSPFSLVVLAVCIVRFSRELLLGQNENGLPEFKHLG